MSRGVSADGSGEQVIDYEPSQPRPAPFTIIAWHPVHISTVICLYRDYASGPSIVDVRPGAWGISGDVATAATRTTRSVPSAVIGGFPVAWLMAEPCMR